MKQRNPEATCGTCPYWEPPQGATRYLGHCLRVAPGKGRWDEHEMYETGWCGEHPDFFLEEEPK